MTKPFHLMTPEEKTALRIAQNRGIDEKIGQRPAVVVPPAKSSSQYVRATPEDHMGSVIRKVKK